MKCPECSKWSMVKATRKTEDGLARSRECGNGHKFRTEETVVTSNTHGGARRGTAYVARRAS